MLTLYLQPTGLIGRFMSTRPLVALLTCRDLLFCAKDLFVAAILAGPPSEPLHLAGLRWAYGARLRRMAASAAASTAGAPPHRSRMSPSCAPRMIVRNSGPRPRRSSSAKTAKINSVSNEASLRGWPTRSQVDAATPSVSRDPSCSRSRRPTGSDWCRCACSTSPFDRAQRE
jgi:hypothetical protein